MGKKIENRDGFFKTMEKYGSDKEYEEHLEEIQKNSAQLEKDDRRAMLISAFLTLFLPSVLILGIIILLALLFFRII